MMDGVIDILKLIAFGPPNISPLALNDWNGQKLLAFSVNQLEGPLIFLHKSSGVFILQSSAFLKRCLLFHIAYLQILIWASYPEILHGNLNYLPYTALTQTLIIVSLIVIAMNSELIRYSTIIKNEAYCLKCAGNEAYGKIVKECTFIKILCYSSLFMVSCFSIIAIPFIGDEHNWQYPHHFIKEHIHYLQWVFQISNYMSVFIIHLYIGFTLNTSMYSLGHIVFQWYILNRFVTKMSRGMVFNLNDIRYQERVQEQLKCCVRMQSDIIRITKSLNRYADHIIFGMIIAASVIFTSFTFFILTGISPRSNFRMSLILLPWFEQMCTYCFYCQQISNESHNVFNNALQCSWYNWNIKNRRTYLLFLTGNTNTTKISMYKWIDADSALIVKVCRLSYVLLTFFLRIGSVQGK